MLLKFHLISLKLAATTPQKSLSHALHGLLCCGWCDTVRSMWRFLSAWRKQKMPQWLPQRCSPCQSRPLRRGGFLGEGRGNFLGERSEISAWRRVVIIAMYFFTVAWVSSKQKTQPFDHHLMLYVVVVFSWLSKVSEPDYEPTHFGIHHMDIADGTS